MMTKEKRDAIVAALTDDGDRADEIHRDEMKRAREIAEGAMFAVVGR